MQNGRAIPSLSLRKGDDLGASASYVAELLVTGLQAIIWLIFACLIGTGVDWIDADTPTQLKDWATLITVFVVALAYALGAIVDRIADSALSRIDKRWQRRWFDPGSKSKCPESKSLDERTSEARLQVLSQEQELNKFLEYTRSRIRLARATSFNLILITLTASILLYRTNASWLGIIAVSIAGFVLVLASMYTWRRISRTYYKWLAWAEAQLSKQLSQAIATDTTR